MSKPILANLDVAIYTRLNTDLVSTHASACYAGYIPPDNMPGKTDKPVVVFDASLTLNPTFTSDDADITITVYIVSHGEYSLISLASVAARVMGNGSTYGLSRWTPTVSGIGTNPLVNVDQTRGAWDDTHIAYVMTFTTYVAEVA